jgi:hypothetical protein
MDSSDARAEEAEMLPLPAAAVGIRLPVRCAMSPGLTQHPVPVSQGSTSDSALEAVADGSAVPASEAPQDPEQKVEEAVDVSAAIGGHRHP